MCELTEITYLEGDVVWVKLGSCWWPGEVQDFDKLPPEIVKGFKKKPIAVVKFFMEDKYEYIRNISHIYKYNCSKKNEFIKKGLDMYRSKITFMDKFPTDVCHAETLTGGDPDIITRDEFAPEQKPNYSAIFGAATPKKSTPGSRKRKSSLGHTSKTPTASSSKQKRKITHPRFKGNSDHEIHLMEQTTTPSPTQSQYICHICGYHTMRLNVIILHNKSHSNGTFISSVISKPKPSKKSKRAKSFATTSSIDEDLELIRKGASINVDESSESDYEEPQKVKTTNKRKSTKPVSTSKKAKLSSICNNLLADWGDSDDDEEISNAYAKAPSTEIKNLSDGDDKNSNDSHNILMSSENVGNETKDEKSCFDFEDEEENTVLNQSPGRKIPRVLPLKSNSKESKDSKEKNSDENIENKNEVNDDKDLSDADIVAFNNLMERTTLPDLTDLHVEKKSDNKSDVSSNIDKTNGIMKTSGLPETENVTEQSSKEQKVTIVTIPKKRIVKKLDEYKNLVKDTETETSSVEVSKLKSHLMNKLNEFSPTFKVSDKSRNKSSEVLDTSKKSIDLDTNNDTSDNKLDKSEELDSKKQETESNIKQTSESENQNSNLLLESLPEDSKEQDSNKDVTVKKEDINLGNFINMIDNREDVSSEQELEKDNQISEEQISLKKETEISDISIDNSDNLSGLSTLAAVSELSENLNDKHDIIQDTLISDSETISSLPLTKSNDMVSNTVEDTKSVQTLANFSMDFTESNSEYTIIKKENTKVFDSTDDINKFSIIETNSNKLNDYPENIMQESNDYITDEVISTYDNTKKEENFDTSTNKKTSTIETSLESEIAKLTNTQPDSEDLLQEQQQDTSSSKLLEILTDTNKNEQLTSTSCQNTRTIIASTGGQKVPMVLTSDSKSSKKFDTKVSKLVIKPPSSSTTSTKGFNKSSKPIILSEKIIKPMTECENVSIKKVTSKRSYPDVEDIDTYIIQKASKKSKDNDQQELLLTSKSDTLKFKTGTSRGRGKPKIIEQTIIKAADKPAAHESVDDNIFDISSMPIVLTDQILTPESIENIPVLTDLIPTTSTATTIATSEKPQQITPVKRGSAIQQVKLLNKGKTPISSETPNKLNSNIVKSLISRGLNKNQKVYQTGSKLLKNNTAVITQSGKPEKFFILPSSSSTNTSGSKYTIGKRVPTVKNSPSPASSKQLKTAQTTSSEPTGNKIMIVTNQQGVQSRVLLTPAQQKILGCKIPATKLKPTPPQHLKGNVQKSVLAPKSTIIGTINNAGLKSPTLASQTIVTSKGQIYTPQAGQTLITSEGQILTPISQQQLKKAGKKLQLQSRVVLSEKSDDSSLKGKMNLIGSKPKTVLIKGAQGQTLKKIQSPVTETKNLILPQSNTLVSVSGATLPGKQILVTPKGQILKTDGKVCIPKQTSDRMQKIQPKSSAPRIMSKSARSQVLLSNTSGSKQQQSQMTSLLSSNNVVKRDTTVIPSKQSEQKLMSILSDNKEKTTELTISSNKQKQQSQIVIPDAISIQSTLSEGQILGLPSGETIDGQSQSYVLVTVDESGNFIPISNELVNIAGGDLNNIVLQFDQGTQENQNDETKVSTNSDDQQMLAIVNQQTNETTNSQLLVDNQSLILSDQTILPTVTSTVDTQQILQEQSSFITDEQVITSDATALLQEGQQAVACSINNGDTSQQLIITGDPESTQKFLASLTEGNTDLSSLLSGTDGNMVLLNTDSENPIILSVNSDHLGFIQAGTESDSNQSTMFVQQTLKNQDILAAALANTDVFQQDSADKTVSSGQTLSKISTSQPQLSPNSSLYPMNVGNVLETSLTLNAPIMTPLEVPSVSSKKVNTDVESTLISQVPSSLELPITITDPSISQTVSQQVMLGNDLQSNLELPISISDTTITSIRSSEMSSPNFYSLPSLEESSNLEQKRVITTENLYNSSLTGTISMPLLTEDPDIPVEQELSIKTEEHPTESKTDDTLNSKTNHSSSLRKRIATELHLPIEEELDLNSTDICSSLSEPPPGMFDKRNFSNYLDNKNEEEITNIQITSDTEKTTSSMLPINKDTKSLPKKSNAGSDINLSFDTSESSEQVISETVLSQEVTQSELLDSSISVLRSPRLELEDTSVVLSMQPTILATDNDNFTENSSTDYSSQDEVEKRPTEGNEFDNSTKSKKSCD